MIKMIWYLLMLRDGKGDEKHDLHHWFYYKYMHKYIYLLKTLYDTAKLLLLTKSNSYLK